MSEGMSAKWARRTVLGVDASTEDDYED